VQRSVAAQRDVRAVDDDGVPAVGEAVVVVAHLVAELRGERWGGRPRYAEEGWEGWGKEVGFFGGLSGEERHEKCGGGAK